jgi:ketosteroid isomerase-like protein
VPDVLPHGGSVVGKEAVGGFFQSLAEKWDDFGLEIDDMTVAGDRAYISGRASGTYRGRAAGYGFVHAWTIEEGACARFDEYVDPSPELVAAAAAAAPAG